MSPLLANLARRATCLPLIVLSLLAWLGSPVQAGLVNTLISGEASGPTADLGFSNAMVIFGTSTTTVGLGAITTTDQFNSLLAQPSTWSNGYVTFNYGYAAPPDGLAGSISDGWSLGGTISVTSPIQTTETSITNPQDFSDPIATGIYTISCTDGSYNGNDFIQNSGVASQSYMGPVTFTIDIPQLNDPSAIFFEASMVIQSGPGGAYTNLAGDTIEDNLSFYTADLSGGPLQLSLLQQIPTVPEPSSLVLMLTGSLGGATCVWWRSRSRR